MLQESPITPNSNYHRLLTFALSSLIFDATISLCDSLFDYKNDPLGKFRGQRTGAAQSAVANIAEGTARGGTSRETEVRLLDVARASLVELYVYCECDLRQRSIIPWKYDDPTYVTLRNEQIDSFQSTDDIASSFYNYMSDLNQRFHNTLFSSDIGIALNSIMAFSLRCAQMLRRQMDIVIRQTLENGGFTERLSNARIEHSVKTLSSAEDAPHCPLCGGPMVKRLAKRGANAGHPFWSCANYPQCQGSMRIRGEA